MWSLQEEFSSIEIKQAKKFRNLTLFVLMRQNIAVRDLDYLLFEDGVAQGKVRVTEIHASGSVPQLRLTNDAELPVLLVDGEELVGAKQNRVLNLTILAPAKQTCVIPVSCVESGRWGMVTADMKPADHLMYSRVRGERVAQVTQAMRAFGSRASDQIAVWQDIAAKATRLDAQSPTGAMSAIYERHANSVEEFVRAFQWEQRQQGVAFAISARVLGMDLFDHPEVMRRFFPKLVRSYALDALDAPASDVESTSSDAVATFITQIVNAQICSEKAVGLGKDVRFDGIQISGAGLWAEDRYIHICAFDRDGKTRNEQDFKTRISRPRRRWWF
jgi:hypothetical protein